MQRDHHAVYVISVAAEIAGVHPQTLRIYERRGLLSPARTSGGNRRYSNADIQRLRRIAELADGGMNLEGIRQVLELETGHGGFLIRDHNSYINEIQIGLPFFLKNFILVSSLLFTRPFSGVVPGA